MGRAPDSSAKMLPSLSSVGVRLLLSLFLESLPSLPNDSSSQIYLLGLLSNLVAVRYSSEDRALVFTFAACCSSCWEQKFDSESPQVIW